MRLLLSLLVSWFVLGTLTGQQLFQNRTFAAGLGNTSGLNISVSVSDYDLDGDEDFFIGRNMETNRLYRNNGDGSFTELASELGIAGLASDQTYAAGWGDLDNDGDPDLYVGNRLTNDQFFRNNGDGTFTDITAAAGINNLNQSRAVLFADVDLDGLLDIYIANFITENVLYMNQGNLTFVNETVARNVTDNRLNLGAMFVDYDVDGDADLYLTHDGNQANILYRNDGNGFFTDVSAFSGTNIAAFGMGVDAGDVNHDGLPDLYITNLYDNELLLNDGDGTFTNITSTARINDQGMGWGTTYLDYDNDGWLDIYVVNNTYFSPFPNVLYRNLGDNSFAVVSENQAVASPFGGYASASTDIDQDGKLDLLVTNYGQAGGIQYFQNAVENDYHWLNIKLVGTTSNRDAVGARIVVAAGDLVQTDEIHSGSGYAAQNSLVQHFGLGEAAQIDRLTIYWPSGAVEEFTDLAADQTIQVVEGSGMVNAVAQTEALSGWEVFPNPVADRLEIVLPEGMKKAGEVTITDLLGRPLIRRIITADVHRMSIDVTGLAAGSYLVGVAVDGRIGRKMVVVSRL